jgi:thiamine biosynthesis lipoprotein
MGTRYSVVFYGPQTMDTGPLDTALFAAVDNVDRQMSTWKADSDLNRINAAPVGVWVEIPAELTTVLEAGLRIGHASNGAFDICMGDVVGAWGFGAQGSANPPGMIAAAGSTTTPARLRSYQLLDLRAGERRIRKLAPAALDLSGIAKGYGVDALGQVMDRFGINAWLAGIDGEMRAKGTKPDGAAWAVAHERPVRGAREAMGVIELTDLAVATSGTYRHYRDIDGKTISHTMNPVSAAPLVNAIVSVTVLAQSCMEADAWATALMVMGEADALKTARKQGMDVIMVRDDGEVISSL